jgi:putative oxidoreductase
MNAQNSYLPAFGRLLIAVIFLYSGFTKIVAPGMVEGYIASVGLPAPVIGLILAILVELGGGILLVIGFQTRIVALVIALYCVATAVFFHRDFSNLDMQIHFLKNIAMAGGLLQIVAFGAGEFSMDARRVSVKVVV